MARLSRRDEFEADEFAAALMIKAGLGTAPQRRLLAKMGDLSANPGTLPDWLMSHPPIPDRIAAIEPLTDPVGDHGRPPEVTGGWLDGRGWLPAAALAPLLVAAQLPAAAAPQPAGVRPVVPQLTGVELTLVRRGERIVRP